MVWFLRASLVDFSVLAVVVAIILWRVVKSKFSYWKKLGIWGPTPKFPFGTEGDYLTGKVSLLDTTIKAYQEGKKHGLSGGFIMLSPLLTVCDPKYLKYIMLKDYDSFNGRGGHCDGDREPLSTNLITLSGEKWKSVRPKINKAFTTGKFKGMFHIFLNASESLTKKLVEVSREENNIDIYDFTSRCALDVLGPAAFGITTNCVNDKSDPLHYWSKKGIDWGASGTFKFFLASMFPNFYRKTWLSYHANGVEEFFANTVKQVINLRKSTGTRREDVMQSLIDLMDEENEMSEKEVIAQSFVIFVAGYETTALTLMFTLLELAQHPEIQDRARKEIQSVLKKHDQITYEALSEMPYLEMVLQETLRKYPAAYSTFRKCNKTYKIPDTDIVIPKETFIQISIFGLHRDPEYYPDPEKYDPERFSPENKKNIDPFTYIPFGEGPRICIGMRFTQIQSKIIMSHLLTKMKFSLGSKTTYPVQLIENSVVMYPKEKVYLNIEEL